MRKKSDITINHSLKWLFVGRAFQIFIQILSIVVLARLLPPTAFGQIAMVVAVNAFISIFIELGTTTAIIQKKEITDSEINCVFWLNMSLSVVLSLTIAATSGPIAILLGNETLTPVILLASFSLPLASYGALYGSLLERNSSYRLLVLSNALSSLVGFSVGVTLAISDSGVYSLVAQTLVTSLLSAILLRTAASWHPAPPSFKGLSQFLSFGGDIFVFNFLNYFHRNVDAIIIGRVFGAEALGIYNLAYRAVLFPLQNITFAVSRALLPAYSRATIGNAHIGAHYVGVIRGISLLTAPIMTYVFFVRDSFVLFVFGSEWIDTADVLAWLIPVGFLQSILSTSGAVFTASGRTRLLRNLGLCGVPFLTLSFVIGIPWGIEGIACCYFIANVLWIFPVMINVFRTLNVDWRAGTYAICAPLSISLVAYSVPALLSTTFISTSLIMELILMGLAGTLAYIFGLRWLLWEDVNHILSSVFPTKRH